LKCLKRASYTIVWQIVIEMTHKNLLLPNFKPTHNLQDGWHKTFTNNHLMPSETPNPAQFGAITEDYQCYCRVFSGCSTICMATTLQIHNVCNSLLYSNTTASSFVLTPLTQHEYDSNMCTQDLLHNSRSIFLAFLEHPQMHGSGPALLYSKSMARASVAEVRFCPVLQRILRTENLTEVQFFLS